MGNKSIYGTNFLTVFFIVQMYCALSVVHRYNQIQKFKLVYLIFDGPGYNECSCGSVCSECTFGV